MPRIYDSFGLRCDDIEEARVLLERVLPVKLVLHESEFWGGDYYGVRSPEVGEITVRRNFNEFTNELTEPSFPDQTILVSVSTPPDPDGLKALLLAAGPAVSFLRRDEV